MSLWTVPAGTIINGEPLAEATDIHPTRITIGNAQYGPEIFELWSTAELAAIGIMPAPPPDPDQLLEAAIAELELRYQAKFAPVRDLILVAIAADGPNMDANIAALRADWQRIVAARSEELDALFLGV